MCGRLHQKSKKNLGRSSSDAKGSPWKSIEIRAIHQCRPLICGRPSKGLSFKPIFFKKVFVGLGQTWRNSLTARAQIADNLRRKSFACGNLSVLAPYFILFEWRLVEPYKLAPPAAALLVRPFYRPTFSLLSYNSVLMTAKWEGL